jgi:hypothetical protein
MAVNAGYRIRETYPSALRYADPLIHFKPLYRYLIGRMNKVFFDGAESKTEAELYQDLSRLKRGQAIYFISGYMAVRIEDELGREVLATTAKTGPRAFIQAYCQQRNGMSKNHRFKKSTFTRMKSPAGFFKVCSEPWRISSGVVQSRGLCGG